MTSRLNPYISFDGNARAAMEFYEGVFGGEGGPDADKIMHGMLVTPSGLTLMGADTPPGGEHRPGNNIAVSLSGDDAVELRSYWEKLSSKGTVSVPLEMQMWGDEFGMCLDPFGIPWMVNIAGSHA